MRKLPEALRRFFKASQKGFTLIELLVVIGILGILISAMVATIDPFEQINKGSDANAKNIAAEFVNGNIRYYTTHLVFPWAISATDACNSPAVAPPATTGTPLVAAVADMEFCITDLLGPGTVAAPGDSELKDGFETVSGLDLLYASTDSTSNIVRVCFKPKSKSGQKDAATKYSDQVGTTPAAAYCKSSLPLPGANDCYWCTQ